VTYNILHVPGRLCINHTICDWAYDCFLCIYIQIQLAACLLFINCEFVCWKYAV